MTVVFDPDHDVAVALRAVVESDVPAVPLTTPEALGSFLQLHPETSAVVLGSTLRTGFALELTEQLRAAWPDLCIILVRDGVDDALRLRAVRAGLRDVVLSNDPASLNAAIHTCATHRRHWGRVTTVFSTKGGTGKTTIATHVAAALAGSGSTEVCLVDLDFLYGDVPTVLHLAPRSTLADAVPQRGHLRMETLRALLAPSRPGLSVLAAPSAPAAARRIDPLLVAELIHVLRQHVDHIVVDTPTAFDDQVLTALDLSDRIVLVTTPDSTALKNLALARETLHMLGYPADRQRVVLNRADSPLGLSVADVERVVGVPVTARIPSSVDVPRCGNRGVPLTVDEPHHPVSVAVARFVDERLRPEPDGATAPAAPSEVPSHGPSDAASEVSFSTASDAPSDAPSGVRHESLMGPREPDELTKIDISDESTTTRRRGGWFGLLRTKGH